MKALLIFILTFVATQIIFGILLGIVGGTGGVLALLSFIASIIISVVMVNRYGKGINAVDAIENFNAEYRCKNMAIDTKANKIWLRDTSGKTAVFDKNDVHSWRTTSEGGWFGSARAFLEVQVHSLDKPNWLIDFGLTPGGSGQNRKCDEWFSRLSTWVNRK